MRYSLLSRFQGALLGAGLGEVLGRSWSEQPISGSGLQPLPSSPAVEQILGFCCDRLIAQGALDGNAREPWVAQLTEPTQLMAASLPVILFFHEQPHRLQQQLTLLMENDSSSELSEVIWVMAGAIAHILQERWPPRLAHFSAGLSHPSAELLASLDRVQSVLRQETSLEQAVQQLVLPQTNGLGSMALALYCFLSTPEDFRLTVIRAVRVAPNPAFTGLLAGGLAGAYGARAGISPGWQLRYPQTAVDFDRAAQLLAAWSGMYQISRQEPAVPLSAVAAPGLIRPR